MIGLFLCVVAFLASYTCGRRALGHGLGATLAAGYGYGIVRANVPDGASHFIFDAAVLGLYASAFLGRRGAVEPTTVRPWIAALTVWPLLLALVPYNHLLVQLVGLRSAIFFLPVALLGARVEGRDLDLLVRWLVRLNLIALSFGVAEFLMGIERFYPHNAVTDLIYRSQDVGPAGQHRIPATFPNAHAYGGTMVATLPLLMGRLVALSWGRERWLTVAATLAAGIGVFLCAARLAAVGLFAVGGFVLVIAPTTRRVKLGVAGLALVVALVVNQSDRLQRFSKLGDTDSVATRVQGSLNMGLVDIALEYPMGAGLGSAVGTSMPYFLQDLAPIQIGMENEYGRIALEQSLVGLGLWLAFIVATLVHRSRGRKHPRWEVTIATTRCFVAFSWGAALVGTGLLSSVPGTILVVLGMGLIWNDRQRVNVRPPVRRVSAPARAT